MNMGTVAWQLAERIHILPSTPPQSGRALGILKVGKGKQNVSVKDKYFCQAGLKR